MMRRAVNQRQYSRISTVPHSLPESSRPSHPLVVNVSQGGACLWLNAAPPIEHDLWLQFQCDGQTHRLQSEIVWSRRCTSTFTRSKLPRAEGWLAGIAFSESGSDLHIADIPHNILRADDTKISFLDRNDLTARNDGSVERHREPDSENEALAVTTFNEETIPGLVAATRELVPLFAKHFSDVRLVCKRDSFEISATFRPLPQAEPVQVEVQNQRAIPLMQAVPASYAQPAPVEVGQPAPAEVEQPAPAELEQPATLEVEQPAPVEAGKPGTAQPANVPVTDRRGRGRFAIAALTVVILGGSFLAVWQQSGNDSDATETTVARQSTPAWGAGLDDALLDGWIDVKTRFDLPIGTLRSAIQIMRANEKYPSAHDLHDLAKYPAQAGRAFSLLAGSQSATEPSLNLRDLKDELESHLMAGARFPDETPGGRYSSLQRELYNNVIVLGVVDLFYRRQDDPAVTAVLAAIRRGGTQQQQTQGK